MPSFGQAMLRRISTIKLPSSPFARVALGLAVAAVANLLSLFLSGAGHGWNAPFILSWAPWLLVPATLVFGWPPGSRGRPMLLPITALTLWADVLLISTTAFEDGALAYYLQVNGVVGFVIAGLWLGIWFGSQAILVYSLIIGHRSTRSDNE